MTGFAALLGADGGTFAIEARHCAADGVLFGGFAVAVLASAVEACSGTAVVTVDTHFLAPSRSGEMLHVVVEPIPAGRRVAHYRASLLTEDGAARVSAMVFTGRLEADAEGFVAAVMPDDVPAAAACPERPYRARAEGAYMSLVDVRLVDVRTVPARSSRPGRCLVWARLVGAAATPSHVQSAASLAVLGDHLPFALGYALDLPVVGLSLTSSLTMVAHRPTEWVLLEMTIEARSSTLAHGSQRLWTEDGHLVGLGSQTMRVWEPDRAR